MLKFTVYDLEWSRGKYIHGKFIHVTLIIAIKYTFPQNYCYVILS